jgi:hypothetical protein
VVTGSGRVSTGVLDILQYLDIAEVSPDDFLQKQYNYPVFTHVKGKDLYQRKDDGSYSRENFHQNPKEYCCNFLPYTKVSDILMNGVYWDKNIPPLFEHKDVQNPSFTLSVIADITCDENGSIPCNMGSTTIEDPTYGYDKKSLAKTTPFLPTSDTIDVMAVDNLPNELPRDASKYFGGYLLSYILPDLIAAKESTAIERATICENGKLTAHYSYLKEYANEI